MSWRSACPACTATTPRSRRCRRPTSSSPWAPASMTASPARSTPSLLTPRSSTSTSTRPSSGGLGTMCFAVPAAVGAKVGRPDRMVWAVDGDGCFQMTAQELVTASAERIPIKVAILNNAYLGMVRQWQEMFYDERYSEVYLSPDLPDYVKWAEAMGCVGFRCESPEEVQPTIDKANEIDDRPVVIDFRTDSREQVYPMVAAGASNDEIVVEPSQGEGGR